MVRSLFEQASLDATREDETRLANFAEAMLRRWRQAQKELFSGQPIDNLSNHELISGMLRQVPQLHDALNNLDDPNRSCVDLAVYVCEIWRRIQEGSNEDEGVSHSIGGSSADDE